jgi:hypothetical protein
VFILAVLLLLPVIVQDRFSGPLSTTHNIYTHVGEGDIAQPLAEVSQASAI